MKSTDILDAIGNVDDELIEKAKEIKKSYKAILLSMGALAACLLLIILAPYIKNITGHDGIKYDNTLSEQDTETAIVSDNVWIYYVDGSQIKSEQQFLQLSTEEIFYAWRDKNGLGEDVKYIRVKIDSNSTTTESEVNGSTIISHKLGDYFIFNITISKNIENYYDKVDSKLLLESLKKTMTKYSSLEYDEYHIYLE